MSDLLIDAQEVLSMRLSFSHQVAEFARRNDLSEKYARIVLEDELIRQSKSLRFRLRQLRKN